MTYPIKLPGRLSEHAMETDQQMDLIRASDLYLGEVEVARIGDNTPAMPELREAWAAAGLEPCNPPKPGYCRLSYTYGAGSVFPHDDLGYGLVSVTLVATAPIHESIDSEWETTGLCVLHTNRTRIRLELGETVIFNADCEHSWMANGRWVLINQCVRRVRRGET